MFSMSPSEWPACATGTTTPLCTSSCPTQAARKPPASTAMRPIAEKLSQAELISFCHAYDASLNAAYPVQPDGAVLFPFKRVFFTLKV